MISPDWTSSEHDAPPVALESQDSSHVLQAVLSASARLTGRPIGTDEVSLDVANGLGWSWMTVGQILWEASEQLGIPSAAQRFSPRSIQSFRRLSEVVDYLARHMASRQPATRGGAANEIPETVRVETNLRGPNVRPAGVSHRASRGLPLVEAGFPMPVEFVSGTPEEMGRQYGTSQAGNILRYIERNIRFLGLERLKVLPELQAAIADPSIYFGESEVEEIKAMSAAADIPWDCVLGHNIGIHPDYVPGCSQFALSARRNPEFGLVHGVNEDLPVSLRMREHLTRVMTVRRPKGLLPHLTFGIAGQVGGLNGINSAGLIVTSTLLLDRPRRRETEHGLIQPILVKRILEAASNIPEALSVVRDCSRNAAWSMCISHFPTDRLCYVEYDGKSLEWTEDVDALVSTNHSQRHAPMIDVPRHSVNRLMRLRSMLNFESNRGLSSSWAKTILRDRYDLSRGRETRFPTMHTVSRVDNQGSFVFVPDQGELWATAGPMAPQMTDRYFRISLSDLFGGVFAKATRAVG